MNLSIFSWVIYDIGNTLFNAGVTGLFFPLWIITKLNGTDATVGYTLSIALLVSLMISPITRKAFQMVTLHGFSISNYYNMVKHMLLFKGCYFEENKLYPQDQNLL